MSNNRQRSIDVGSTRTKSLAFDFAVFVGSGDSVNEF